jgi:hypothetical protein
MTHLASFGDRRFFVVSDQMPGWYHRFGQYHLLSHLKPSTFTDDLDSIEVFFRNTAYTGMCPNSKTFFLSS